MIAVSLNLITPYIIVWTMGSEKNIKKSKRTINETSNKRRVSLRRKVWSIPVKRIFATIYVHPTTIVFTYNDIPKVSSVNWVR
jgi:hypothetical protein